MKGCASEQDIYASPDECCPCQYDDHLNDEKQIYTDSAFNTSVYKNKNARYQIRHAEDIDICKKELIQHAKRPCQITVKLSLDHVISHEPSLYKKDHGKRVGDYGKAVQKGQLPVVPSVDLPERSDNELDDGKPHDELERIRDQPSGDIGRILYDRHECHFDNLNRHIQVVDQFPVCFSHFILPAP